MRFNLHRTMNNILMTFSNRSAKFDPADIHKGFFPIIYNIDNILNFIKQRTHAHSVFV